MEGSDLEIISWKRQSLHMLSNSVMNMLFGCLKTFSNCIFVMRRRRRERENPSTLIITPPSLSLCLSLYSFISLQIHISICLCLCDTWIHFVDHRHTQTTTQGKIWEVFCSCLCTKEIRSSLRHIPELQGVGDTHGGSSTTPWGRWSLGCSY